MTAKLTEGLELARACARAADEMQAEEIRVWDLRGISTVTDYIVVCSGNSMPHLRAVLRDVEKFVHEWLGVRPVNAEGRVDSRWVVLDYIDVMVHVMHGEMREHYGLERLWGDAKEVEWRVVASKPGARKPAARESKGVSAKAAAGGTGKKAGTAGPAKPAAKKAAAKKPAAKRAATGSRATKKAAAKQGGRGKGA